MSKCQCTTASLQRYREKISQPLLDRMDLCVSVSTVGYEDLIKGNGKNESSAQIRKRVIRIHECQRQRFSGTKIKFNSEIPAAELDKYCALGTEEADYMKMMYEKMDLTARTFHKILRVARTIADMESEERIARRHLREAICYRGMDTRDWRR